MASKNLPGVYYNEIDNSAVPGGTGEVAAAVVGWSAKGASFGRSVFTNYNQFKNTCGKADPSKSWLHYAAREFFRSGTILYVTRIHDGTALHASNVILAQQP